MIPDLFEIYRNHKVLITGHTGFKGSWLCLILNKLGADIYGYALEPPTKPSLYEEAKINELVTSFIGDIRDLDYLKEIFIKVKPEIVIHMAAQPLVRDSYIFPVETYFTNVMGTVHLLEACRKTPSVKAIVNVTTDKCYENKEWHWGYRENEPMGGYDPYSNSKGCSELVTSCYRSSYFNPAKYAEHGTAIASARAGNVIGGGDWATDRLIPDFIRAIKNGESLKIRSPYATRPWQHVLEPLNGYLTLAALLFTKGPGYNGPWNFGPAESDARSVEWITLEFCERWGNGVSYSVDSHPQPHEATYLKLDCSKAANELDWSPKTNIGTALQWVVDWYKAWLAGADMRTFTETQVENYFSCNS